MRRNPDTRRGFTLIELMVVVVILGILALIGIGNFATLQDHARVAGVRSNAHTVQMVAEDYAALELGIYAASISQVGVLHGLSMVDLFPSGGPPLNPFTQVVGVEDGGGPGGMGMVTYGSPGAPGVIYVIYGADRDGNEIIRLTNGSL